MPTYAGDVVNGKWYAQSPYGATNASGGVNVAPYGPWNGMPASGYSPVIGTPTNFTVGAPSGVQVPTIPGLNTTADGSTGTPITGGGFTIPGSNPNLPSNLTTITPAGGGGGTITPVSSTLNTSGGTVGSSSGGFSPGAAPNLGSLTQMINQLNLQGQQAANAGRIPGEQGLEAKSSQNIGQELAGQLPADVINQLQQQAAERGISTGSPGSDNSNAAYLRALGLNSLQEQQMGQQNLSQAVARNPVARTFDPTSQLLTPYQAGELNNQNALLQLDWYKALTGQNRGSGGGGGGQPTLQDTTAAPTSNWFSNLMGGTPSPPAPPAGVPGVDNATLALNQGVNLGAPGFDLPDVGGPSVDQFNNNIFDPTGSGQFDPTSPNYNPFAGYA